MASLPSLSISEHSRAQCAPLWRTAGCTIKEDVKEAWISVLVLPLARWGTWDSHITLVSVSVSAKYKCDCLIQHRFLYLLFNTRVSTWVAKVHILGVQEPFPLKPRVLSLRTCPSPRSVKVGGAGFRAWELSLIPSRMLQSRPQQHL